MNSCPCGSYDGIGNEQLPPPTDDVMDSWPEIDHGRGHLKSSSKGNKTDRFVWTRGFMTEEEEYLDELRKSICTQSPL